MHAAFSSRDLTRRAFLRWTLPMCIVDTQPVSNQIDMTCYIVSALASVADNAPDTLVVSPMLPEMKLEQGIRDRIMFGHPIPRKFESVLCPGEVSSSEEGMLLVQDVISRVKEEEGANGRHLIEDNLFNLKRNDVERETEDRTLQDENLCQDVFGGLKSKILSKGGSFSFESPVQSTHEDVQKCLLLFVTGLASQPEVCWIGVVPDMVPLNAEAQWVSQSRQKESRPFFDVGLTGKGQVIAVSDSGLDTDNCYFWDATGEVAKDGVSTESAMATNDRKFIKLIFLLHVTIPQSVDMSRRKVVQYVALGDSSDDMKGHGTHVAGTAAGQRATDGISESPGEVDGIAPAAKLAFVDLGVAGKFDRARIREFS